MFRFSSPKILLCVFFCFAICNATKVQAQTAENPTALPPNQAILAPDALEKIHWPNAQTFDVAGQTFARALRVNVPRTQGETNAVQITINNVAPIKKGDVLLASFAARGQATAGTNVHLGAAQIMFLFERNSDPWTKSVTRGVALPNAIWRRVAIPFVAQEDYATGAAMASLRLAFGEQTIELADLQVRNFGAAISVDALRDIAANLSPLGALDVTIDTTKTRQTMRGLGGNYTGGYRGDSGVPNDHVAQYTRANLNPVHARLGFSLQLWQPQAGGSFVTDGKNGEVLKMATEFAARKVPLTVSIWEAPDWMTASEGEGTRKIIPEAQWDAAIGAIAAFLERAQNAGAGIETLSFNEADWGVDIHWTPARLAAFIKRAAPEFARRGLKTKWLVGDTTKGAALVPYARPLLEDAELRPFLGPIAFHSWDALGASDATYREIYQLAAQYHREVWCLEAGSDAAAWQLEPKIWPTWNYALDVALVYAKTIGEARANVVDYWTYHDDYPLVDQHNQPYPVYEILRQFNDAFGAGTQIVETSAPSADLRILAGVKPDGTTVAMLINPVGAGQVTLRGLKPKATVTFTLSDEKGRGVKLFEQATVGANGAVVCALPARAMLLVQTN